MRVPAASTTSGVVAVVLAGGQGSRLHELTDATCKPAVPFANGRRIIDWTMDNLRRASLSRTLVATQYKPGDLVRHLDSHWRCGFADGSLLVRHGPDVAGHADGYRGTADAVTQNLPAIVETAPQTVLVVAADHIYSMDYDAMIAVHRHSGLPVTVAVDRIPLDQARSFGILATDADGRVCAFAEKPRHPQAVPGDPAQALASMGVYAFDRAWLEEVLHADAADPGSGHDFGNDILPAAVARGEVGVYDPTLTNPAFFWRDVGTLDALRETCIRLAAPDGPCASPTYPHEGPDPARTAVLNDRAVVLPGAYVARGARLGQVIVAPGTVVPSDVSVGFDPEEDARYFRVTAGGTVLVSQSMVLRRAERVARSLVLAGPFRNFGKVASLA